MLEIMSDIIRTSIMAKSQKESVLTETRLSLEILKHLIRTEHELKIIDQKTYIRLESMVIEISKMATGWIKYLKTQNPAKQQGFI
jgi:hypothetical protein